MKKYKVRLSTRWSNDAEIEEVEVEKETDKSIWINGNRCAKVTDYASYFNTWERAWLALNTSQQRYSNSLKERYEQSVIRLKEIESMSEPNTQ